MALSKLDKEKQLRELTSIVTGIRLFNRDCKKGGDGIDDREWGGGGRGEGIGDCEWSSLIGTARRGERGLVTVSGEV